MKKWYYLIRACVIGILTTAMLCVVGCQREQGVREQMDEAVEESGEATADAVEEAGDEIEEASDEVDG